MCFFSLNRGHRGHEKNVGSTIFRNFVVDFMKQMSELGKWRWQEPGTAWRGVGVYHITLTVPSREPLFVPPSAPVHLLDALDGAELLDEGLHA